MNSSPPMVTVRSSSWTTRLPVETYAGGSAAPSRSPETIDQSPCNFFKSSLASAGLVEAASGGASASPRRRMTHDQQVDMRSSGLVIGSRLKRYKEKPREQVPGA